MDSFTDGAVNYAFIKKVVDYAFTDGVMDSFTDGAVNYAFIKEVVDYVWPLK